LAASDVFDGYGYGRASVDFLNDAPLVRPDWIITNPPFNVAAEFTLHALTLARRAWRCWSAHNGSRALNATRSYSVIGRRPSTRRLSNACRW
jgi:hypothetical protein